MIQHNSGLLRDLLILFVSFFFLLVSSLSSAIAGQTAKQDDQSLQKIDRKPWLFVNLVPEMGRSGGKAFSVIRELSGNPKGIVVHFSKITYEYIEELQPEFMVLSPQGTPWCRYTGELGVALQNFLWMLPQLAERMDIPMLGICGGHQALALAFGGKVGPIRAGEDDCMPYTKDRQTGVVPLTVTASDPIFSGVDGNVRIVESHYDEVKVLPPGFVLLASEKVSPYQIMRHPNKPVYGIQGHPEYFYGHRPDGGILIKNFLKIAGEYGKNRSIANTGAAKVSSEPSNSNNPAAY